jgi:hypothetical protein
MISINVNPFCVVLFITCFSFELSRGPALQGAGRTTRFLRLNGAPAKKLRPQQRRFAVCCIAELHSARRAKHRALLPGQSLADYKSAIQQTANLRYDLRENCCTFRLAR